jgi:hypothetical protein
MARFPDEQGTVESMGRLNVRVGAPSSRTGRLVRKIEAGVRFAVKGVMVGESVQGVDQWFVLGGDAYVWSGACRDFEPSASDSESDQAAKADEARPSRAELGVYMPPRFKTADGVQHVVQGRRPSGLEGLIVHFDASRIRKAGNGPEDSDNQSLAVLRYGAAQRYHYGQISRTGTIFLPENFEWGEWGSHAGRSVCPATGRSGVSRFYVGFEMNNPGLLYEAQEDGVFCPWFNSVRNENGAVILDRRGRCTRQSVNGEWYRAGEVRRVVAEGNIKAGIYLPYSFEQFEALTNLCLYLDRTFSSFSLDRVFGHDEVAPSRKNDPGGALANPAQLMTMAEFRAYLKSL